MVKIVNTASLIVNKDAVIVSMLSLQVLAHEAVGPRSVPGTCKDPHTVHDEERHEEAHAKTHTRLMMRKESPQTTTHGR